MGLLNWIRGTLFRDRTDYDPFVPKKIVKIHGVPIVIKKINPLSYLQGCQTLQKVYDTYKLPDKNDLVMDEAVINKVKVHYTDVFMSGISCVIIHGKKLPVSRTPVENLNEKIPVEHLMSDWSFAEELYLAIIEFTYGKKKLK